MTALAHYRKGYEKEQAGMLSIQTIILASQWIAVILTPADQQWWRIGFAIALTICVLAGVIIRGIPYLQAKRHRPAIWVQDDSLYVISPLHFRMRMDDIASWQVVRRSRFGFTHTYVALNTRKGKERLIGPGIIADQDRFLAWLTHLFGPQTPTAEVVAGLDARKSHG